MTAPKNASKGARVESTRSSSGPGGRTARQAEGGYALVVLPIAAALVAYAGSFRSGFIWDDPLVLEQLRSFRSIRDLLVTPDAVPKFYYRPFVFLTFLIDRSLGGESPFWFHATVIFWHAAVSGLVFVLLRRVLAADTPVVVPALAATLFAVHPVHVESVAWIAGRSDVIATTFALLTLLLAQRTKQFWTCVAASATLFLGLCSKEAAVAVLVLVPLWDLCRERRLLPIRYVPLVLTTALYFTLRHNSLGTPVGGLDSGVGGTEVLGRMMGAVGWYVAKMVVPVNLNAYVPEVPPATVYPMVAVAAVLLGALGAGWAAFRANTPLLAFFIAWFFVTLAPSLVVIVRRSASAEVAERYLYMPSVGFFAVAAFLLSFADRRSRAFGRYATTALALLAIVFTGQSLVRGEVWADEVSFWSDVARKSPGYMLPHRELGDALLRRERLDEAVAAMQMGLDKKGSREDRVMLSNNLGNLYFRQGKLDEADRVLRAGLAEYPHPHLYSGLGRVSMRRAELAQARGDQPAVVREVVAARDALRKAVELNPDDEKSHSLLGQVLLSLNDRAGAREHLTRALEIQPNGVVADTTRQFLRRAGG